jgi:serine/threonine-protein kinase HipA
VPDDDRALTVWCFGRPAGTLTDARQAPVFVYEQSWLDDGMPPLSQSLPLDGPAAPETAGAFFGGLLPEGAPRELMARRLGVSPGNDFALLAAVGGDTAGAISLQPPGLRPPDDGDVEWLDEDALTQLIDDLPTRPMHADEDGEYRLSLAGAQDKLPVVVGAGGRIGLTKGQTPSTHILKTPIARLDDTVANEAFCLALGRAMGIDAATAAPHRVGTREFLLVERYDRRSDDHDNVTRLHQEDFCQALGVPAQRKYQAEGGPSLADCFALLRTAAAVPAREIVRLLDHLALSFLVGNHDAHGKNHSLLYLPKTADAVLAPAYDVLSIFAYHRKHNLSRKMAMAIGGEYRPEYLRSRHLARMLDETGLGAAAARRRLLGHASAVPELARAVRADFHDAGWDAPVLEDVIALIDARAAILGEIAAPVRRAARR